MQHSDLSDDVTTSLSSINHTIAALREENDRLRALEHQYEDYINRFDETERQSQHLHYLWRLEKDLENAAEELLNLRSGADRHEKERHATGETITRLTKQNAALTQELDQLRESQAMWEDDAEELEDLREMKDEWEKNAAELTSLRKQRQILQHHTNDLKSMSIEDYLAKATVPAYMTRTPPATNGQRYQCHKSNLLSSRTREDGPPEIRRNLVLADEQHHEMDLMEAVGTPSFSMSSSPPIAGPIETFENDNDPEMLLGALSPLVRHPLSAPAAGQSQGMPLHCESEGIGQLPVSPNEEAESIRPATGETSELEAHSGDSTLPFAFKAFSGIFSTAGDGTRNAQLLGPDQLSLELMDKIKSEVEKWNERAGATNEEHPPQWWNAVMTVANQCAWAKISTRGANFWTVKDPQFYACFRCINTQRLCFRVHDDELWLLPMPAEVSASHDATSLDHYMLTEAPGLLNKKERKPLRGLWRK